ncbi:hypothetical protein [Methylomonas methanica]|uniref:Intracellular septation protein A n=1 Tax=Methylomonas methanica TaxID=421 RepID=A0A177MLS3_METMH|nr:hypothetical protein [Methylomonas methanica]OAI05880.1 hypothetical protein A1332_12140 [Methylomonas methanica]
MGHVIKPLLIAGVVVAYPFLSAYLTGLGFASLELIVFAALTLWRGITSTGLVARLASFTLAAVLLAGAYFATTYFVWLVPSFAYLWLTFLFGHTLWSPPSFIERLVRLQFPELVPGITDYCRNLTWVWTLFFAVNIVICAALPLIAGQTAWALYTGVVVYLLMGLLGTGEWFYRHRRFPDLEIPPALETFKVIAMNGHKVFKG